MRLCSSCRSFCLQVRPCCTGSQPRAASQEFIADTPFGGMKGTEPKAPYVPKFTPELTFAPSPSTYSLPGVDDGFLSSLATLGEDGEEPELDPKKPLLALVWKVCFRLAFCEHAASFRCARCSLSTLHSATLCAQENGSPRAERVLHSLLMQDLAVAVRANGKVLLNYVAGRVTEGFYAVMVSRSVQRVIVPSLSRANQNPPHALISLNRNWALGSLSAT